MSQVDFTLWLSLVEFITLLFVTCYGIVLLYVFDKFIIFYKLLFRLFIQLTSITNCVYKNIHFKSKYKNIKNLK